MTKLIALFPLLLLAGCYTSDRELVSAKQAAFPYQKIVYQGTDSEKPTTLLRSGNSYVTQTDDAKKPPLELRFMPLADTLYAVQLKGMDDKKAQYLFALVKLDAAAKTAQTFAAAATKADQGPDLKSCGKTNGTDICLTRLEPYLIHALAGMATGEKPFDTYKLLSLE